MGRTSTTTITAIIIIDMFAYEFMTNAFAAAGNWVGMIGFAPGFPYLLGLDPALAAPRHATPRVRVPAGSVGIAGQQTGIYPGDSPGGWQLVGRTPLSLFDPRRDPPSLLQPGQRLRFVAIGLDEYNARMGAAHG